MCMHYSYFNLKILLRLLSQGCMVCGFWSSLPVAIGIRSLIGYYCVSWVNSAGYGLYKRLFMQSQRAFRLVWASSNIIKMHKQILKSWLFLQYLAFKTLDMMHFPDTFCWSYKYCLQAISMSRCYEYKALESHPFHSFLWSGFRVRGNTKWSFSSSPWTGWS